ncbi:Stomatin-like protein 2, mitochondrial [Seminavis robusta]|uniref:Stomatin-like protein 2, mitochondrial n=1 Tax=Seminavis robusta TaxID=568900 RepID=A0A9N8E4I5_9STRA|nr:Stomatin-like protein 2, mitochondrial [Seminavis robusta]|eukprot:Sro611_g175240.1 Stomatin-like protein 2, mitochondrial (415) ;mRNA; r:6116-7589
MRAAGSLLQRRGLLTFQTQAVPCIPQALSSPLASVAPQSASAYQSRRMSSYVLGGLLGNRGGGNSWQWPVTQPNTIFNIVPQGHKFVVERFGKLHSIEDSGWFFGIPFVDKIAYIIDIRERAMDIPPQSAITRDNVSVEVSGNLFVRFNDPERAAYGAFNPLYSVTQHSQSAMRSAIGEMELDEILHGRARLNSLIKGSLQEAAIPWGLEIRRYEITEITPDQQIRIAMDKQAAAERDRREQVLRAEGAKRKAELESEGVKISLTNESEGNLIKIKNEADATKTKIQLEAQGQAQAISNLAEAQAQALRVISAELNKPGGQEAARLALAREYVTMYGEMGKQSNTILFNERPADVNALLTQAVTAMQAASSAMPATTTNPPPAPKETITAAIVDTESSEAVDTKAEEKSNNTPV